MQIFAVLSLLSNTSCTKFSIFLTAEREEMISCVYVSRDEERVAVAFSRPVNVSISTYFHTIKLSHS